MSANGVLIVVCGSIIFKNKFVNAIEVPGKLVRISAKRKKEQIELGK